ncbi:MAG TPA: hypothetical protein VF490_09110 [Chryseosolibacter sp.]
MKSVRLILISVFFSCAGLTGYGQRLNLGLTFQYHVLKQVKIDAPMVAGTHSYSQYLVKDNRWKFFSAGQSIVIGTVLQVDYKKIYAVVEPSFDLNTYNYSLYYPTAPGVDERLSFHTLFYQVDVPIYIGYQFGSTNLIRYSVFAGGVFAFPYFLEYSFQSKALENPQEEYFNSADMDNILYSREGYANALLGFCLHFASLGKVDVRYQYRLGSPGDTYPVSFHTVGMGLTFYLPLKLRKKTIYYEE